MAVVKDCLTTELTNNLGRLQLGSVAPFCYPKGLGGLVVAETNMRQEKVRRESDVTFQCFGKPELFGPYEKMTEAAKEEFKTNGPIPCEGGGRPGFWCADCRFAEVVEHD
jgi:hypothetical protein